MRPTFIKTGLLSNTIDKNFRPINQNLPGFGFAHEMTASTQQSANVYLGVAHVRRPAINYTVGQFNQLWESFFKGDDKQMVSFFYGERDSALKRALALDAKIVGEARKLGGDSYVKIVSAALRQVCYTLYFFSIQYLSIIYIKTFGGIELVGTVERPWLMLKEISSNGNCHTVDMIYPHMAVHLYLNPKNIKYMLDPLFDNMERGFYPHKYSLHDLGARYPRCIGHRDGKDETMEVEESGNMLIMTAAYVKSTGDKDFAVKHYKIIKQWTDYLVEHGLIPGIQLTTEDYMGKFVNSTNLSIKAIIGIGAMAQLAQTVGNTSDQKHYRQIAEKYVTEWIRLGEDPSGKHMKATYNTPNTWFMLYNLYGDKLLDMNLVPEKVNQLII